MKRKTEKRDECKVESYRLWQSKAEAVVVEIATFKRTTIRIDNAYGKLGTLMRNAVADGSSVYRHTDPKTLVTTWGAK